MKQIFLIFFFNVLSAQNLVVNPSFEIATNIPLSYGEFHRNVYDWSSPSFGTPDYYSVRSQKMNKNNYRGIQDPKAGNCFAGIYLFAKKQGKSYREYVQGTLKQPLKKGATYKISFHLSLSEKSTHSLDKLHALFSLDKRGNVKTESRLFSRQYVKPKPKDGVLEIDTLKINEFNVVEIYLQTSNQLTYNWFKVQFTYKALGFENYIIIGNLNNNNNTNITQHNIIEDRPFSYYYIDNVEVIKDKSILLQEEKTTFYPEKTYTFKNVLFEFNEAELVKTSIKELNKLSQHLSKNKSLNIEIYGHTDNVGLKTRNKELSQQRAKAVSEYLIRKGLNKNRITWFGFGSEAPIAKNDTEKNQTKNRRVEFKFVSQ